MIKQTLQREGPMIMYIQTLGAVWDGDLQVHKTTSQQGRYTYETFRATATVCLRR